MSNTYDGVGSNDSDYFVKTISSLRNVKTVEKLPGETFNITLVSEANVSEIKVYLTDPYTLGMAGYFDIRSEMPEIDYIIFLSEYSDITDDVSDFSQKDDVFIMSLRHFIKHINGLST